MCFEISPGADCGGLQLRLRCQCARARAETDGRGRLVRSDRCVRCVLPAAVHFAERRHRRHCVRVPGAPASRLRVLIRGVSLTRSEPHILIVARLRLRRYSTDVRRFVLLIVLLQLVAGGLVGQAHAEQLADSSDIQTECGNVPGADGDQTRGSCDVCSHGLMNDVGLALPSSFPLFTQSNPVAADQSAPNSWLDDPAGEPPK